MIIGELRQGANEGVLTDAVAKAAAARWPTCAAPRCCSAIWVPRRRVALTGGDLDVGLTPLVGVQPMLAATAASVTDALALTGPASVEWKLDGARVQVHRAGDEVRVFTRTLHEIGERVPEIVEAARALPIDDVVLDGESLGLDLDGNPLKFQDTMSVGTTLQPFFFDVLHAGGDSLIDRPLHERKAVLASVVPPRLLLPTLDTADAGAAEAFARTSLDAGHEGVMIKSLDSPYQAGRRGNTWRKVKPVHTLDLVVLAAEWGHGRRRGWLSNLHLGARGDDGTFVMVGKTFKGMTDALLEWQTAELQRIAIGDERMPTHTSCTSAPSTSSRSRSTACSDRVAIPAGWRCASPASGATATTSRRPRPTPSRGSANCSDRTVTLVRAWVRRLEPGSRRLMVWWRLRRDGRQRPVRCASDCERPVDVGPLVPGCRLVPDRRRERPRRTPPRPPARASTRRCRG